MAAEKRLDKPKNEDEIIVLLLYTKGAKTRIKILKVIELKPKNCNQLSKELKLNWWTIQKHLQILLNVDIIECLEFGYFRLYRPTARGKQLIEGYLHF